MKYLFFIYLCLVLYRFSCHSLRMKVTLVTDCITYKDQNNCVANINCEWDTNCQTIMIYNSNKGSPWNKNSAIASASTTPPKMQSAIKIK